MGKRKPTVFVVDDNAGMRKSLTAMVGGMQLQVECFTSGEDFLSALDDSWSGCLVVNEKLPGMSGLELQDKLIAQDAPLPLIFITGCGDVWRAVEDVKKGAVDFLEIPYRPGHLRDCIRRAIELDASRRREQARRSAVDARLAELTLDERAVLEQILAGATSKEIASHMDISLRTVQLRRASLMKKLRVDSRAALFALAVSFRRPSKGPS